jgi:predicted membrane channel-forming protein YqfA (hemolysin III family)
MRRVWAIPAIGLVAAVPVWSAPLWPVIGLEGIACVFCVLGLLGGMTVLITIGAGLAVLGYAIALSLGSSEATDIVGAAIFGLSLLFLLNISDFIQRFSGADIHPDVLRAQTAYWLGRAVLILGCLLVLMLGGFVISLFVPAIGKSVIAGLGAIICFAGALRAGTARRPGDL